MTEFELLEISDLTKARKKLGADPLMRPKILPSATQLARTFDRRLSIYNAHGGNGKLARAGLARTQTVPRLLRIACKGDSITRGISYSVSPYPQTMSYPQQLKQKLKALGYRCAGDGFVIPNGADTNMTDARWSTTGTWQPIYQSSGYLWSIRSSGVATITFTTSEPCTRLAIHYYNHIGAAVTVTVDGASVAGMTPNSSDTVGVTEYTGLANTLHTVVITTTGTFVLHGIDCTNTVGGASGFVVDNYGRSGASTLDWRPDSTQSSWPVWRNHDTLAKRLQVSDNNQLNVSIIHLGTNDSLRDLPPTSNGQIPADYKTNLDLIIQSSMAVSETMLSATYQMGDYLDDAAGLPPYNEALYQLADTYDLRVLDLADRWVDYTTSRDTMGFISADQLHPTAEGYSDIASGVVGLLGAASIPPVLTAKTPLVGADQVSILDSSASNQPKTAAMSDVAAYVAGVLPNGAAADQDLLGRTWDEAVVMTGTILPAAATMYFCRISLRAAMTVTNVCLYMNTVGNTLTNSFVALYKSDGTKLGQSADQSTAWGAGGTTGPLTIALTAPVAVPAPASTNDFVWAVIYVGAATTLPTFGRGLTSSSALINLGTSTSRRRYGSAALASTTTLTSVTPSSMAQASTSYWMALS